MALSFSRAYRMGNPSGCRPRRLLHSSRAMFLAMSSPCLKAEPGR
ncbi:hypothetical protein [Caudoviricetes sp.]|nr:hypothetical protein [Caudoviricetes sp.]